MESIMRVFYFGILRKPEKSRKPEKLKKPEKPEKPDNAMKPTYVGLMRLPGSAIKPTLFDNKCKTM